MPYTKRIPVHAGERGTGLYPLPTLQKKDFTKKRQFVVLRKKVMR